MAYSFPLRFLLFAVFLEVARAAQGAISVSSLALNTDLAPRALFIVSQSAAEMPVDPSRVALQVRSTNFDCHVEAPILQLDRLRAWSMIPVGMVLGPAEVRLLIDGVASEPASVNILAAAPVIFTDFSTGAAFAQNVDSFGAVSRNGLASPALPGRYVTLWATGLGRLTTSELTLSSQDSASSRNTRGQVPDSPASIRLTCAFRRMSRRGAMYRFSFGPAHESASTRGFRLPRRVHVLTR